MLFFSEKRKELKKTNFFPAFLGRKAFPVFDKPNVYRHTPAYIKLHYRNGGDNIVNERLIAEIGARAKSNSHRIEKLEEIACEIHKQNENIAKMVAQMEFMNKQLSIHDAKLSEIENRPQKQLGSIITAIITALCGALIGGAVTAVLNII